jgi:hypothetical protein
MLACLKCLTLWVFSEADLAVDDRGLHFICAHCGGHNKLINIGSPKGPMELIQPDITPTDTNCPFTWPEPNSFG